MTLRDSSLNSAGTLSVKSYANGTQFSTSLPDLSAYGGKMNLMPTCGSGGSSGLTGIATGGGKHASSNLPTSSPATGSATDPFSGAPFLIHSWIAASSSFDSGAAPTGIGLPAIMTLPGLVAAS